MRSWHRKYSHDLHTLSRELGERGELGEPGEWGELGERGELGEQGGITVPMLYRWFV